MALLAVVPLLAMAALVARAAQRVKEESERQENLALARAGAAAFSAFVADVRRAALPAGEALAARRPSRAEAERLLGAVEATFEGQLLAVSWATPAGKIVDSSRPAAVGLEVADRAYFVRILAGDETSVSGVIDTRSGRGAAFVIAVAVRDRDRRLAGVVLAPADPAQLARRALPPRTGGGGYALIEPQGRIAVRTPALSLPAHRLEVRSRQPIVARALDGQEASGVFEAEDGSEQLGAAVPIPDADGWVARASRDLAEVRAPVRRELARAGAFALGAAVAWLAIAARIGRRITRSLALVEAHAAALGRGERAPRPRLFLREADRLAEAYTRMAERLRASREAFATALEAAPAGILVFDGATLRARWANRAFLAALDEPWQTRGIEGLRAREFLPGIDQGGLAERFRRVASGDLPFSDAEDRYDGFARGPTWWRWSLRTIPSADRVGTRDLLVLAREVTKEVRARRRVEEDRRRLETVLRTLPVGVVIADRSGGIALSNEAASAMLGGAPSRVALESIGTVHARWSASGDPLAPDASAIVRAQRGERIVGEMIDATVRDGRRVSLLVSAAPVVDGEGELTGAVATFQDATALRRAERRERILHAAGAASSESLDFGEIARRLVALAVPQLADCCCVDEVLPDGALAELAAARGPAGESCGGASTLRLVLAWRAVATRETARASAEGGGAGEEAWALEGAGLRSALVVPLVGGGHVLGVLTLATGAERPPLDRDDAHVAEELGRIAAHALGNARAFEEVRRAVETRDEVLSVVSHDLRTPLGTVAMGARLLADLPDAPGALERARATGARLLRVGERMARLIGDLLDLASLRAGRLELVRDESPPAELVREAAEDAGGPAREKGLEVRVDAPDDLPFVRCDRDRILQVLGNLASNAVKATDRGEVRLAAEAGDREVVFSVSDTGPGIPEAEQVAVFERFRRGAGARYAGAGLGLAIARALVEAHGGRIWVESRPGAGTTMRFALPADGAPEDGLGAQGPAGTSPAAAAAGL